MTAQQERTPSRPRRRGWGRALLNLALAGVIFVGGAVIGGMYVVGGSTYGVAVAPEEFDRIAAAWETLYAEYVDAAALDPRELAYGAIAGMTEAVGDTGHTRFLTPDEATAEAALMSGSASSVDWEMVQDRRTGLIRLDLFAEGAGDAVAGAVRAARAAGATSLVLDLRGNAGGILDEAIAVAGVFLEPGSGVVRERDRAGEEILHVVPVDSSPTDLPLVVLVDGDSASSSEVVAAALQDAERATVVGTTTTGTGTILSDYEFDDGALLSIGTATWFTPSGRSVWHVGVTPDVVRSLAAAALHPSEDTQLRAALELLSEAPAP